MSNESSGAGSWWSTLPGILTATAAVLTATSGLLAILAQNGVLGEKGKNFISGPAPSASGIAAAPAPAPAPASSTATSTPRGATAVSDEKLTARPFSGALVTMADGSQVKLRDDIREWCSGASLKSVQGQTIGMDLMRRFDIVDWASGSSKGVVKIVLNNGQVLNEKIDACGFRGRNDLGDFVGDFDKIRSVEFVR